MARKMQRRRVMVIMDSSVGGGLNASVHLMAYGRASIVGLPGVKAPESAYGY